MWIVFGCLVCVHVVLHMYFCVGGTVIRYTIIIAYKRIYIKHSAKLLLRLLSRPHNSSMQQILLCSSYKWPRKRQRTVVCPELQISSM